jgi:protocatechuate 3,4-dioxygenase beta subunit
VGAAGLGALGATVLPGARLAAAASRRVGAASPGGSPAGCWITPELTEGPFYFDPELLRQDIREGKPGVLLELEMSVIDVHCDPQSGALVDIWHCDKDGCYSGYTQETCDAVGETFLRGTQVTDVNGVVRFTTIYPGWYPGRATHIHFKVRSGGTTYSTSQFAFPDEVNAEVYASPLYVDRGPNPISNEEDNLFGSATPQYLIVDVTGDVTGGYQGTYTIGLAETTGIDDAEAPPLARTPRLTGRPAPFRTRVTLEATLPHDGSTHLAIYDTLGRRLRVLADGWHGAGTLAIIWDGRDAGGRELPAGVYIAQLEHAGRTATTRLVHVR